MFLLLRVAGRFSFSRNYKIAENKSIFRMILITPLRVYRFKDLEEMNSFLETNYYLSKTIPVWNPCITLISIYITEICYPEGQRKITQFPGTFFREGSRENKNQEKNSILSVLVWPVVNGIQKLISAITNKHLYRASFSNRTTKKEREVNKFKQKLHARWITN